MSHGCSIPPLDETKRKLCKCDITTHFIMAQNELVEKKINTQKDVTFADVFPLSRISLSEKEKAYVLFENFPWEMS